MRGAALAIAGALMLAVPAVTRAQGRPVTRAEVVAAALARAPRLGLARADADAARAGVTLARQWENPVLALDYTRDAPRDHLALGIPLDVPSQRRTRLEVARLAFTSATQRLAFEREAVGYDADTSYTQALVAAARARLSERAARDADSLVTLASVRRDAGDASELDVELARVSAGQLANAAAVDALQAGNALLGVQALMGLPTDSLLLALADTLDLPPLHEPPPTGTTLLLAAAEWDAQAADLTEALERKRIFTAPSLSLGFETRDPGGLGNQVLPTIGLAVPLPLFNRNRAGIQAAGAQRDRAQALLTLARIELVAARARATRSLGVARERVTRSLRLSVSAQRVVALSLLAYQEGAVALPLVLEAQRTSRETLFQVLDDIAAVRNSAGLLRLLSATVNPTLP